MRPVPLFYPADPFTHIEIFLNSHMRKPVAIFLFLFIVTNIAGQQPLVLPEALRSVTHEFSGMAVHNNRLYLLPQYGSHLSKSPDSLFLVYTIRTDSIDLAITQPQHSITNYRTIRVRNLDKLPPHVKNAYDGLESILFVGNRVFFTIESHRGHPSGFVLCGTPDTKTGDILVDPSRVVTLKRFYDIHNAGYESLTFLISQQKLLAAYEFNASATGNIAYLIDTSMRETPVVTEFPFAYFRTTDMVADTNALFALNYYFGGEYHAYLDSLVISYAANIAEDIPELRENISMNSEYLNNRKVCLLRIMRVNSLQDRRWQTVRVFKDSDCSNNWEGMVKWKNGFLLISDGNGKPFMKTTLQYVPADH